MLRGSAIGVAGKAVGEGDKFVGSGHSVAAERFLAAADCDFVTGEDVFESKKGGLGFLWAQSGEGRVAQELKLEMAEVTDGVFDLPGSSFGVLGCYVLSGSFQLVQHGG